MVHGGGREIALSPLQRQGPRGKNGFAEAVDGRLILGER
jgi:hypothetical protein